MLQLVGALLRNLALLLIGAAALYLSIAYAIGIYAAAWSWILS